MKRNKLLYSCLGAVIMKQLNEYDKLIDSAKKIHMIGIGGAGMCPLAEILLKKGYELTGSDNNQTDTLSRIQSLGIPVTLGHFPENVHGADLVIHSAAIMKDNPELLEAARLGIPTLERSYLLGAVTRKFDNVIGVCGTHGKTTVTSMITQILQDANLSPSAVIGGKLPLIGANGICGDSETLVCESCEYVDTFLKESPDIAVLLNIDEDHMEYFKTVDRLISSFRTFIDSATKCAVVNGDDQRAMIAAKDAKVKIITAGENENNDYRAVNISMTKGGFYEFDLLKGDEALTHIVLGCPGRHNVSNAVLASVAALLSGATPENIRYGLSRFGGAGRRFEILGRPKGITIADDYAHHPKELEVTLNTAKSMGFNRVFAVFQPFTFSRTVMLMDDFARVLNIADNVVLAQIMGSREVNTYGVHVSELSEKIDGSVYFDTFDEIADHIVKEAKEGDLVITLGCGDIYKAAKIMLKKLGE